MFLSDAAIGRRRPGAPDAGRFADGRLFDVMKRVRGRTLREHMEDIIIGR